MKVLRLLLSSCLLLAITGCIPAVLVAGTAASSTIIYDNRSFKTIRQDRHAAETAQTLLDHDKKLKGRSHISVTTFNHLMLMIGETQTDKLRSYAYQLLSTRIKNVRRIYNEVKVAGATSFLQRTNDSWITTKVKAEMLAKKNLHSTEIKVITENGTVYLLGLVSRWQGGLAADVARHVAGVRKVVKVFEYT